MNWLFLRVIVRPQGKVIDGVSLLALTVKGSSGRWLCGILFFREHCRKKRNKSLFHLISAAFLTGRGWCSGFFLFSFVFFFLFFLFSPLPVLQIYVDCRDFSIRPPGWDLMYHYKKWTGTSAEYFPTFLPPWKRKSWTAIGTRCEGLSYSSARGEPRLLLMRSVHVFFFYHQHFRNMYYDSCFAL